LISAPASARKVLLFRDRNEDERLFQLIADGKAKIVRKPQFSAVLAEPNPFAPYTIVGWGTNQWRETATTDITPAVRNSLQEFVRAGGDLIMFEQYEQANMTIIDDLFGLKTRGGGKGATFVHPDLLTKVKAAGFDDAALKELRFHNGYDNLPAHSLVLVKSGDRNTVVVIPFGRGRLILIGLTNDPTETKFEEALLDQIYQFKPSK
jgi:hypothetical protein